MRCLFLFDLTLIWCIFQCIINQQHLLLIIICGTILFQKTFVSIVEQYFTIVFIKVIFFIWKMITNHSKRLKYLDVHSNYIS